MKASDDALRLIKHFESLRLQSYLCPAKVPTNGYGHIKGVRLGQTITSEQADIWLAEDIAATERYVAAMLASVNGISQNQFDALVSWVFNIGPTLAQGSTLLKLIKKGAMTEAADQFPAWNKITVEIGGVKRLKASAGLTRRRMAERTLFLFGKLRLL